MYLHLLYPVYNDLPVLFLGCVVFTDDILGIEVRVEFYSDSLHFDPGRIPECDRSTFDSIFFREITRLLYRLSFCFFGA